MNLDHMNAVDVTLIVNVFQFFENDVTGSTVRFVCDKQLLVKKREKKVTNKLLLTEECD